MAKRRKERSTAEQPVDPLPPSGGGAEGWGLAAYALALATLAVWGVLGSRPGGDLQLWLYGQGRFQLVLAALVVAGLGLARALRSRPFLQRRRCGRRPRWRSRPDAPSPCPIRP